MRLTKTIREAFVRAAMQDVPKPEDFEAQARKLVIEDSISKLPAIIQPLARNNELRFCIRTSSYWFGRGVFSSVTVFEPHGTNYQPSPDVTAALRVLMDKANAESEMLRGLEQKLTGAVNSCTTRKALVTMLPEFEKYLPADEAAACKTLPAIANIVADFAKAGWPKGSK